MEKILLVIDAINPDIKSFEFACYLAKTTHSKLTGVFLENIVDSKHTLQFKLKTIANSGNQKLDDALSDNHFLIEKNIEIFKDHCNQKKIDFNIHRDRGIPVEEIIEESRFADVLIVDAETSFNKKQERLPTELVSSILRKAECPTIIAAENFETISEIIFSYENSDSSLFAIKQFTHLFPHFSNTKMTVLHVNETGIWQNPEKHKLNEWLQDHYTNIQFEILQGITETRLFEYLLKKQDILVIMGAYGRNKIAQLFKNSHADILIKTITQPIFIAHI
jgi:hypothetical protein